MKKRSRKPSVPLARCPSYALRTLSTHVANVVCCPDLHGLPEAQVRLRPLLYHLCGSPPLWTVLSRLDSRRDLMLDRPSEPSAPAWRRTTLPSPLDSLRGQGRFGCSRCQWPGRGGSPASTRVHTKGTTSGNQSNSNSLFLEVSCQPTP